MCCQCTSDEPLVVRTEYLSVGKFLCQCPFCGYCILFYCHNTAPTEIQVAEAAVQRKMTQKGAHHRYQFEDFARRMYQRMTLGQPIYRN